MVFSSVSFLFYFLPIFLVLYGVLPWRNAVLLIASLIFYSWGEPQNLPLLLICIAANYGFGMWIGHAQTKPTTVSLSHHAARLPFIVAIGFNLGALLYYKYFNFALSNWYSLQRWINPDAVAEISEPVALPLGISFFTFHAISYLVDVYRKKTKAERSFTALFTYIIMFPQLVAGPIVRFSTVARQLHHRRWSWLRAEAGARFFCLGLAQKILLANTVAVVADKIFSLPNEALSTPLAWLGALCYSLQIYFDFAGYSLMAIGLGLICGFSFPRNFNLPYVASSVTEFWRRWHMSLSRWFRDYVYIPLGGNRHGLNRTLFNLFLVFFLCGLWHGANWTFVVWGMLHGSFLVIERLWWGKVLSNQSKLIQHAYTLLVVMLAWVVFRANDFDQAASMIKAMFGWAHSAAANTALSPFAYCSNTVILALACAIFFSSGLSKLWYQRMQSRYASTIMVFDRFWVLGLLVLCSVSLASGAYNPFIYFRF